MKKKRIYQTLFAFTGWPDGGYNVQLGEWQPLLFDDLQDREREANYIFLKAKEERKSHQFGSENRAGIGKGLPDVDDWTTITVEQPLLVDDWVTIRHKM